MTPRKPKVKASPDNFIRQWRLYRGFECHKDLAEETRRLDPRRKGLDRVTICRLETGVTRLNQTHLYLLAPALGCEPWQLIAHEPLVASSKGVAI